MKSLRIAFALLFLAAFSFSAAAQERYTGDRECGTEGLHPNLLKYRAGEYPAAQKSATTLFVPSRFIIFGDNDGNGYIDPQKLLRSFNLLNSDFEDMNIQFYISEVDYVNRSAFNDHENFSTGNTMMAQNNKRGVINNYIVANPAGACGYYSPGPDALALGKNCMGASDRTWSHEMGHLLTLPHTFFGWESVEKIDSIDLENPAPATVNFRGEDILVERMDSSNCLDAADGFCDTAPDYLMQRWTCNGDGMYRDSLLDPDSTRFAVSGFNVMSYALDNCIGGFSEEQKTAMQTDLARRQLANDSGAGAVAANGDDMNLLLPEHLSTLEVSDRVELIWNSVPNADYYVVQLNNSSNFNGEVLRSFLVSDTIAVIENGLQPNQRYFWKVRPLNSYVVESEFGEQTFRFKNGEFATSTIDAALDAAITASPNPVSAGRELLVTGRDLGRNGSMSLELIDAAGRVLVSRESINVNAAGFTERVPTEGLPTGVYFLRLRLNNRLVTKRVMVTF